MPQEMYDEDEVAEAEDNGYERGLKEGSNKLKQATVLNGDCHFIVRLEDLADALYNGTIPSRSINGSGSRHDARVQAEAMLAACGMLK